MLDRFALLVIESARMSISLIIRYLEQEIPRCRTACSTKDEQQENHHNTQPAGFSFLYVSIQALVTPHHKRAPVLVRCQDQRYIAAGMSPPTRAAVALKHSRQKLLQMRELHRSTFSARFLDRILILLLAFQRRIDSILFILDIRNRHRRPTRAP